MPRGRPRRESTGSVDSSTASPRRRRSVNWKGDNVTRLSRSSIDVLLAWLTAPGNFARWSAARSHLGRRLALCREINTELRSESITHRQDMDIYHKLGTVERSFLAAKKWLEETALLPKFLEGRAGKDVEANVRQLCPHYKELAPAFAASQNASAAATVVDIDDDDDGDNDDGSDDTEDGEGRKDRSETANGGDNDDVDDTADEDSDADGHKRSARRSNKTLVTNGSGSHSGNQDPSEAATSDSTAAATAAVGAVVNTADSSGVAPPDAVGSFVLSESSQPESHDQSIVRDSASTPSRSQDIDGASVAVAVRRAHNAVDNNEETKENDPMRRPSPASASPPPQPVPRSPPKQLKRLRQRLLPQPQLTDDELSSQGSPGHFKSRVRKSPPPSATKSSSSSAALTAKSSPASTMDSPARTALRSAGQLEKQSIAPKRKTSNALRDAVSIASSISTATPPSARKKQKTETVAALKKPKPKPKPKQQRTSPVRATTAAAVTTAAPSTPVKSKSVDTMHPEELAAVLRACEEEREQRHTLFSLQCDKLMQELEEKKVQVVFETARARQKLLAMGVTQSEVDRILPL